jgi:hypothetical protein
MNLTLRYSGYQPGAKPEQEFIGVSSWYCSWYGRLHKFYFLKIPKGNMKAGRF